MRARKRFTLVVSSFLVAALSAGIAEAQRGGASQKGGPGQSNTQFSLRREEAGGASGTTARQRARSGDCAGALPAFDTAIRGTIEPTLRRDRGLCHEKLGDPFPAIDDYRFYLTARPDAPDADQIRDRLGRLEEQVGVGGRSSQQVKDEPETAGASASVSVGTDGESSSSSSRKGARGETGPRPGEQGKSYDYYASQERLAEAADQSALRYGTGWMLGPFLMLPRYLVGDKAPTDSGFVVGAAIRYAWSPSLSFISELGYSGIGTAGSVSALSGPLVFAGFEYRIPLNQWASDQLFLGAGPGFERLTVSGTRVGINIFELRARFGYRHVFGPSVALEVAADGGPAYFKAEEIDGKTFGVIGANFAFIVAF
jgi:hypothetical protein